MCVCVWPWLSLGGKKEERKLEHVNLTPYFSVVVELYSCCTALQTGATVAHSLMEGGEG